MSTTVVTPVAPMALKDIKEGTIYTLKQRQNSDYGYVLTPGTHLVRRVAKMDKSITTYNLEAGKAETFYPVTTIPFIQPEEAMAVEKLAELQLSRPSEFAGGFGADRKLGTDPEVFAVGPDGKIIPAYEYLNCKATSAKHGMQGTGYHQKANSVPYWDGFQGEFTVVPIECIAHLTDFIQGGLQSLHTALTEKHPGATLTAAPVLPIPADVLAGAKDEHVELGCMPSLNVYEHSGDRPGDGRHLPVRFAGFHMHMSIVASMREKIPSIIRMMDKLCAVTSVCALQGLEDPIRRRYYGLAGEHRLPKHGLEWRVLSSAVLWHPAMVHLHFNLARVAAQLATAGMSNLWQGTDEEAVDIINTLDVDGAKKVLERNRQLLLGVLGDTYVTTWDATPSKRAKQASFALDHIIMPGFAKHIKKDMARNWALRNNAATTTRTWAGHSGNNGCQFVSFLQECLNQAK